MAYTLSFFCRSGENTGASALARLLTELGASGPPLLVDRGTGEYVDEVAACRLAADDGGGVPGWIHVELSVGVEFIADRVIAVSPDDAHGIWGSDLEARLTLTGDPDWPLVDRVWRTLTSLWSAVAWDETSGFEVRP